MAYNAEHGITPKGVRRAVQASLLPPPEEDAGTLLMAAEGTKDEDVAAVLAELEEEMLAAADRLEFEKAALLRDQIALLKKGSSGTPAPERKSKPYFPAVKAKARRRK